MTVNYIFFNSFGRLRSGWRFLIFLFSCQIILAIFNVTLINFLGNPEIKLKNDFVTLLIVTNLGLSAVALLVGWLCGKIFEQLPFRALGFSFSDEWFKNLSFGLGYGALTILFAALIAFLFGGVSFELNEVAAPSAIGLTLGLTLIVFIVGAIAEEALFRGYALQTFTRANLVLFGVILTSALFASGHIFNPNANAFSWINTFLAGIFFSAGYYKTRTLWFPFGLHLMWNWMQGPVLGIPVSGLKELTPAPLFQIVGNGTLWLTGGDYGIEAGFSCTAALIVMTIAIWFAPFLKPTAEMLELTSHENTADSHPV